MVLAFSFAVQEADARKRKRKKRREAKVTEASEETKIAITKMMGKFKWDMTANKVLDSLELTMRDREVPKIRKVLIPDPDVVSLCQR